MSSVIIIGSSRKNGNTHQLVDVISKNRTVAKYDLLDYKILPFDYEYKNKSDDFGALIAEIIQFDTIVFATPVYWYSMSATLKTFIDRFSDLLDIKKDLGRTLRGKSVYVVASYSTSIPRGFEDTFEQTCAYLGMKYLGTSFFQFDNGAFPNLNDINPEVSKIREVMEI